MSREDIIRMAFEAGFRTTLLDMEVIEQGIPKLHGVNLELFAELVAAASNKRKPLNTDRILATWFQECVRERSTPELVVAFARAIERAHNIGESK